LFDREMNFFTFSRLVIPRVGINEREDTVAPKAKRVRIEIFALTSHPSTSAEGSASAYPRDWQDLQEHHGGNLLALRGGLKNNLLLQDPFY